MGNLDCSGSFVVVLWHVSLLVKVQPSFPGVALLLLLLVNLLPVGGIIAFSKGFPRVAASLVVVPLVVGLIIGGYSHFLSAGSDNVLRMSPGELTLPFQVSAVVLAALEALGCWVGFRMYGYR